MSGQTYIHTDIHTDIQTEIEKPLHGRPLLGPAINPKKNYKEFYKSGEFMLNGFLKESGVKREAEIIPTDKLKLNWLTEVSRLIREKEEINNIKECKEFAESGEYMLQGFLKEPGVKSEAKIIHFSETFPKFEDQKHIIENIYKFTGTTASNQPVPPLLSDDSVKMKYECPRCGKIFRFQNTLNKHTYRTHKSSVRNSINTSPIVFFSGESTEDKKATLRSLISLNGTVLSCTVCGKTKDKLKDKNAKHNMEQHIEILHTEGSSYQCSKCDNSYRCKKSLHQHTYRSHK